MNAGLVYSSLGQYEKAADFEQQGMRLAPDRAPAYANQANFYIAMHRFDDVGEADLAGGPRQRETSAGATRAAEQSAGGELAHQFLRGRERDTGIGGKLGRAEARTRGPAGGGGHQNDRIICKMAKAHIEFGAFQSDLGCFALKLNQAVTLNSFQGPFSGPAACFSATSPPWSARRPRRPLACKSCRHGSTGVRGPVRHASEFRTRRARMSLHDRSRAARRHRPARRSLGEGGFALAAECAIDNGSTR